MLLSYFHNAFQIETRLEFYEPFPYDNFPKRTHSDTLCEEVSDIARSVEKLVYFKQLAKVNFARSSNLLHVVGNAIPTRNAKFFCEILRITTHIANISRHNRYNILSRNVFISIKHKEDLLIKISTIQLLPAFRLFPEVV